MNIALLGYGRMGRQIEHEAQALGHTIVARIEAAQLAELEDLRGTDTVVIEFTRPEAALENVMTCLDLGLPIVSGTTGWQQQVSKARDYCLARGGAFLYASNFSPGVQLMLAFTRLAGQFLKQNSGFEAALREVHHTQKLDSPSGTAVSLVEALLQNNNRYRGWQEDEKTSGNAPFLPITAEREDGVVGVHEFTLQSDMEELRFAHTALDRTVFARGAVQAAAWLRGKKGVFGMEDVLFGNQPLAR